MTHLSFDAPERAIHWREKIRQSALKRPLTVPRCSTGRPKGVSKREYWAAMRCNLPSTFLPWLKKELRRETD